MASLLKSNIQSQLNQVEGQLRRVNGEISKEEGFLRAAGRISDRKEREAAQRHIRARMAPLFTTKNKWVEQQKQLKAQLRNAK